MEEEFFLTREKAEEKVRKLIRNLPYCPMTKEKCEMTCICFINAKIIDPGARKEYRLVPFSCKYFT